MLEIARRVGVCRKTAKRYITKYEVQSDPEKGVDFNSIEAAQRFFGEDK